MEIKVEKSNCKNLSKQIHTNSTELDDVIKELNRITRNIGTFWKGDGALKFSKKIIEDYSPTLTDFSTNLKEYSQYLEQAMIYYQKLEDTFAGKNIEI